MSRSLIGRRGFLALALSAPAVRFALAADATEVVVAVSSTSFVLGGVRIGEQAGIFQKHGLRPHIIVMDSGNAAMSAMIGGSAQFSVAGPAEVLAARARGVDVLVVASLYRGLAGSLVLSKSAAAKLKVPADASIAQRLKALDGLTLAVPSPTSALLAPIRASIDDAGAKARFTYMAQPSMAAALESGAIDGMVASFPFAGTPILRGTGVRWIDGPRGELPAFAQPASSSTLQATGSYVAGHPGTVHQFQQALVDVGTFIREQPEAARAALAKGYPALKPEEIDLAFDGQKDNWTKPYLSADDMNHELTLLRASVDLPGLATIDPGKLLVPAA